MVEYQGIRCIKMSNGNWCNELVKREFCCFDECTRYIDRYLENKNRKQILILSVIALIIAIVSVSVTFMVR